MPDEPTQLSDVIVIGTRAVPGAPRGGGSGGGGTLPESPARTIDMDAPPIEPESVWTEETAEAENERQDDCAALKFDERVTAAGNRGEEVEHFSITWRRNGETATTGIREATGRFENLPVGSAITSDDFNRLSGDYGGIPLSSISGFNHSHAAAIYCDGTGLLLNSQRIDNQTPSDRDWRFADVVTRGRTEHGLILYIRDCEGQTRAFDYARNSLWRTRRLPIPAPISRNDCTGDSDAS